ncbi:hypothetical protein FRC07_010363 [Ceratobasidium sp. 392]|nr:hypothetical protein FRC07_010363 [Ceratobasidium sp. 392]
MSNHPDEHVANQENKLDDETPTRETLAKATQLMKRLQNLLDSAGQDISALLESTEASSEVVYVCAILFWNQFQTDSGTLVDLDIAITLGTKLLQLVVDHDPEKPGYLFELALFYQTRFKRLDKIGDITSAIALAEEAILFAPDKHPDKPRYFNGLSISYMMRFHRFDELMDLEKSIGSQEQAVELTPDTSPEAMRARLNNLGSAYQSIFERLGRIEDLDKSVTALDQAMKLTPNDHPHKPVLLNNLGNTYQSLFQRQGRLADLEKSVHCFEQMAHLVPDDHQHKPIFLNNLGNSYRSRFERLGRLDDLEKSIDYKTRAVQLTSDDHPYKPVLLSSLANSYQSSFDRFGRLDDLNNSIGCLEQTVLLTPDDDPDKSEYLNSLGISYQSLFDRLGRLEDINRCIEYFEQALCLTPDDQPHKPIRLSNLGVACYWLFKRLGNMEDLDRSVKYLELALLLAPDDEPERFTIFINLGNSRQLLFWRLGRLEDLQQAVSCFEQAEQLVPDDHPDRLELLTSLGKAYRSRFEQSGTIVDLDKSISYFEQVTALTSDDEPLKAERVNDLGDAYQSLFQRLDRLEDLDRSVSLKEQAVKLTPGDHPNLPGYIANLGNSYWLLFGRLGRLEDLEKSVSYLKQAVALTPEDSSGRPELLNSLGNAYQSRFDRLDQLENLKESIRLKEKVVELTPHDHPDKSIYLMNLGLAYHSLFECTGNLEDIDKSVDLLEQGEQITPDDHSLKPILLLNLGILSFVRFASSTLRQHVLDALAVLKHASLLAIGSPAVKLRTSELWARVCSHLEISSLEAYTQAMVLLPHVVWLGTSVQHRYEYLSKDIKDLITNATAAAISLRRYDLAIEWLEQGRSIVWSQTLQLRTPLDLLQASHPATAEKLKEVSSKLENVSLPSLSEQVPIPDSSLLHEAARTHRRLAENREELIDSIRRLRGFEGFLQPLSFDKLVDYERDGTAVIINVHESHCDALAIEPGSPGVTHVSLENLTVQKAQDAHAQLLSYLHKEGRRRGVKYYQAETSSTFTEALTMLWYDVVQPILARLGITHGVSVDVDDLPRITWCTTGVLSFLPLHAAGDHTDPSKVLANLAISSYAPTLGSLGQSTPTDSFTGLLAIGHESSVRGLSALPGTRAELDRVQLNAQGLPFTRLDDEAACADSVLEAMTRHSWVHIACHGSQNPQDPMKSAFHLHDKDLDLATITRHPLENAQLAFLSACETATGYETLPDESVHLAAGLLMSGYSTVIATMWSIHDDDAPLVAGKVYEYLLEGGVPDSRKAAKALHKAVDSLREKVGVEQYARWMPYVHIGR